jgi:hypothetical protein
MLPIHLIPPLRNMKPFLHPNILSYVVNTFNPPTKEHETPYNSMHSTIQFTKTAISMALKHVPVFPSYFWDQMDTWFLPHLTQHFTF